MTHRNNKRTRSGIVMKVILTTSRYGLRVFDPSFMNTAMIASSITYIDGNKGFLMHRGYPIEQLAEKSNFLETAYLLIYGELPSKKQYNLWSEEIMHHTFVADDLVLMMKSMRYDAHPMSIFISAFAAMSAFAPEANPSLQSRDMYIQNKVISITSCYLL